MTTTATRATKASASERERELEEALDEAQAEHEQARQRHTSTAPRSSSFGTNFGSGRATLAASSRIPASRGQGRRRARSPPRSTS
jgi:hypothetical protein